VANPIIPYIQNEKKTRMPKTKNKNRKYDKKIDRKRKKIESYRKRNGKALHDDEEIPRN